MPPKRRLFDPYRDYDMAGRSFRIVYETNEEEVYQFVTGEDLFCGIPGEPVQCLRYGCRKMDETIRLIAFDLPRKDWYECITLIVDEENGLVTRVRTTYGCEAGNPNLSHNTYTFGAIKADGKPLTEKRHRFTTDLTGKKIAWSYPGGFINLHIYLDHFCRAQAIQRPAGSNEPLVDEPIYEEPAVYIKIRSNVYMVLVTEVNLNRRRPDNPPTSGNIMVVINTDTMQDIGRNFRRKDNGERTWNLFHAEGAWYDGVTETELAPSPNYEE